MSNIVQERGQPDKHASSIPLRVVSEPVLQESTATIRESVVQQCSDVHHADRMLEARVHRPGVEVFGKRKLPNPAEALKHPVIDDVALPIGIRYEPANRYPN